VTPLELAVVTVVLVWAARSLVADGAALASGQRPRRWPGGGAPGPARAYARAVWRDSWRGALARHHRRQRHRRERAAAGPPGGPSRWRDPLRDRLRDRWSEAWQRRTDRARGGARPGHAAGGRTRPHTAGPGHPGPNHPTDPGGRSADPSAGRTGEPTQPRAGDGHQRRGPDDQGGPTSGPDSDRPRSGDRDQGDRPDPTGQHGQRGQVIDMERRGGRWVAPGDTDQQRTGPATAAGPRQRGDQEMPAEVTGLSSAQQYVTEMRSAMEGSVSGAESYASALQTGGVSGPAVDAAARAMELQQQAAAAWGEAEAALQRHMSVREQYEANPDAGSREFVTAE